jgi:hypothetical protein
VARTIKLFLIRIDSVLMLNSERADPLQASCHFSSNKGQIVATYGNAKAISKLQIY